MFASQTKRRRRSRWEIDNAIHQWRARVHSHQRAQAALAELVNHVRAASSLLRPAQETGRPGWTDAARYLRGLAAVSYECRYWRNEPATWLPGTGGALSQFHALAQHLFGGHAVPRCMTYVWFEQPSSQINQQRMWFRHLAAGHSLRGLALPFEVTKSVVAFFQESPAHLTIEQAFAWSRLRPQGLDPTEALDQVDPWRHFRDRAVPRAAPRWESSGLHGYRHSEPYGREWHVRTWEVREVLDTDELVREAEALHHCVDSDFYVEACHEGRISIWSVSCTDHRGIGRRELTVQVNASTGKIVHARGKWNRRHAPAVWLVVLAWAKQEGLSIAAYV